MEETILSIDQAGPDDVRACATVLTRALGDDDVLRAIIRGENRPPRVTALYVALLESGPIAHRTVDVVRVNGGPIVGVGMWTGPDQDESWLQHPIQPLREIRAIGLRHLSIVRAMDAEYASFRPQYPHWYLTDLAVDPEARASASGRRCCATASPRSTPTAFLHTWRRRPPPVAACTSGTASRTSTPSTRRAPPRSPWSAPRRGTRRRSFERAPGPAFQARSSRGRHARGGESGLTTSRLAR